MFEEYCGWMQSLMGEKKIYICSWFFFTSDLERYIRRLMKFQSTAVLNKWGWAAKTSGWSGSLMFMSRTATYMELVHRPLSIITLQKAAWSSRHQWGWSRGLMMHDLTAGDRQLVVTVFVSLCWKCSAILGGCNESISTEKGGHTLQHNRRK